MNAISLNNLWSYLQGLALTANNKRWLADHLYEEVKEEERESLKAPRTHVLLTENELPEIVRSLIGIAAPVTEDDLDGRKAYYEHLNK